MARVCEIAKIGGGERIPPKTALSVQGTSPPKPTPGIGEEGVFSARARMKHIPPSSTGLRRVDPLRSCSVAGLVSETGSWRFRSRFLCGIRVYSRIEELEPSLDSGVMVPHFAYAFQYLVVGEYVELGSPRVAAEAFENPNDAAGLQINRSPMPFQVERSSADVRDGFYGAVRLLLFESCAKPVDSSAALHVERT